ncbi:MAG: melibiase, partial [Candidatus Sulfotelmatobacter sp.]
MSKRIWVIAGMLLVPLWCAAQQLTNDKLSLSVNSQNGSYQLAVRNGQPVLSARVGAQVDHQWLLSSAYPRHSVSESTFDDGLGPGRQLTVTCSGLEANPDLVYIVQLYERAPYGTIQVKVHNSTEKPITIQAIREAEAIGEPLVNLGGRASADRILSDSFSEDWPDLRIFDLGKAPGGMHRGVGSQLIYNRESKQSLFLGVLTSDRFLTLLHLNAEDKAGETQIASYTVESAGTTEIQKDFDLGHAPADDQVELSLSVGPGEDLASERLLFEAGP